jgi:hypothetical protein
MKYTVLFILVLFSLAACKSFDKRAVERGYVKVDSTQSQSTTTIIDSTFNYTYVLEGDSIIQMLQLQCDSNNNVQIAQLAQKDGRILELEQTLRNNVLSTKVVYRERKIVVPWRIRSVKQKETGVKYVTVYKTPKFWKFTGWVGIISIILLILYILLRNWLKVIKEAIL